MSNQPPVDPDFITHLREEKLNAQQARSAYTQRKLAFGAALLGVGALSFQQLNLNLNPVLYLVPFVAAAFDLYILGEDFSVKRIGSFLRERGSQVERDWENLVSQNRDPFAPIAMPILSSLMALGAAVIIWIASAGHVPILFWPWLIAGFLPSWALFFYYRRLRDRVTGNPDAAGSDLPEVPPPG